MANKNVNIEKAQNRDVQREETKRSQNVFVPPVDIYENHDQIVMLADMPGVDQKNVDLTIEDNVLTIEGKSAVKAPDGYKLGYSEYRIGDYYRTFNLSEEVDQEKIDAQVRDGVLKVVFAKAEQAKPKKIKINVS